MELFRDSSELLHFWLHWKSLNHWKTEKSFLTKVEKFQAPLLCLYLAGRVAYHIALGLFLLFAFLQENIWYLTLLTENSDRKVDTGGLGCNRCSLWHPILLAWTYFCSQKGLLKAKPAWRGAGTRSRKNKWKIQFQTVQWKKTLDCFDLTSNLS